jgi:hypothetical protein
MTTFARPNSVHTVLVYWLNIVGQANNDTGILSSRAAAKPHLAARSAHPVLSAIIQLRCFSCGEIELPDSAPCGHSQGLTVGRQPGWQAPVQ